MQTTRLFMYIKRVPSKFVLWTKKKAILESDTHTHTAKQADPECTDIIKHCVNQIFPFVGGRNLLDRR